VVANRYNGVPPINSQKTKLQHRISFLNQLQKSKYITQKSNGNTTNISGKTFSLLSKIKKRKQ
jgi:hypothetical protein